MTHKARETKQEEPPEPLAPAADHEHVWEGDEDCAVCGRGLGRSKSMSRLTPHGWIAGVAGSISVLGMGWLAAKKKALDNGWGILSGPTDKHVTVAFALLVTGAIMFVIELGVRMRVDKGKFLSVREDVKNRDYGRLVGGSILVWLIDLGLLKLAFSFYEVAGEYGFKKGADYYKPWFAIMDTVFWIYLVGGLPYVLLTRALQDDPRSDRKQAAFTVMKVARLLLAKMGPGTMGPRAAPNPGLLRSPTRRGAEPPAPLDRYDRSAMLGLLVKLFFVPVMTVFFWDQFSHLVKNWDYMLNTVLAPGGGAKFGVHDFYNVSFTVIFSVDVGLAWCGYVISSRWIKNTIFSAEPSAGGWLVALLSYPPINRNFGLYFSTPGENGFLTIGQPQVVMLLAFFSVASFCVYTSATVCFGLRFSNLTHRGIVTTGPYAYVRHPAYAAKNFSWWCVMFPFALYQAGSQKTAAPLINVVGLLIMTSIYYLRARTEERHLGKDPEYRAYMKKVPYRFIPGVF